MNILDIMAIVAGLVLSGVAMVGIFDNGLTWEYSSMLILGFVVSIDVALKNNKNDKCGYK